MSVQPTAGYHSTAVFDTRALDDCSPGLSGTSHPYGPLGTLVTAEGPGLNMTRLWQVSPRDSVSSFGNVTQALVHCLLENLHTMKVFSEG